MGNSTCRCGSAFALSKDLKDSYTLEDLLTRNLKADIDDVYCPFCKIKTSQSLSWQLENDFVLLELLRGEERSKKIRGKVLFDPTGILIQGQRYQIIASSHHNGSISAGHWFTKVKTQKNVWWMLDGLNSEPALTNTPGNFDDGSLTFLVLMKNY